MDETDLRLADGRTLHVYDTAPGDDGRLPVFWHHGTPNLGAPPEPLFEAGEWLGIRWISFDRPGYGGSTVAPGRTMASVAHDLTTVADHLGVGTFALMGYSGGGSYALGSAAVLGGRVEAVAAFAGPWGWLGSVAGDKSMPHGPDGLIDDDCSYVLQWGCDPASITAPTLLFHGEDDGIIPCSHGRWLAEHIPAAALRLYPGVGHISVLAYAEDGLEWI